jgi:hypothetical protein
VNAERRFNEGAAEVKRLLNRDRSSVPDLDKPAAFGTDDDLTEDLTEPAPEASGRLSEPFPLPPKAQLAKPIPFGGSAITQPRGGQSPFGGPSSVKPFKEPSGLSPDMEISPITDDAWWKGITLTQVVIALSFVFTIGLMVATFYVVWKMGAIRLNE